MARWVTRRELAAAGVDEVCAANMSEAGRQLLRHPARRRILLYVQRHPGAHFATLVRDLGLGWGNARHHIDRMAKEGLLVREAAASRVYLFAPGQVARDVRHLAAVLQSDVLRMTAERIGDTPGIRQVDLAEALGVSATAVRKNVGRLEKEGLVDHDVNGRENHYRIVPERADVFSALRDDLRAWNSPMVEADLDLEPGPPLRSLTRRGIAHVDGDVPHEGALQRPGSEPAEE